MAAAPVPALTWQLLRAAIDGRVDRLRQAPPAPAHGGPADAPAAPSVDAWLLDAAAAGRAADPGALRRIGRAFADEWGRLYPGLCAELDGRPDRVLRLVAAEVVPHLFPGTTTRVDDADESASAVVHFAGGLPSEFVEGLLDGFVALAGTPAAVRRSSAGAWHVQWTSAAVTQAPSGVRPLRAAIRPPFLVATIVPFFVALAIAAQQGPVHAGWALLTLVGVVSFQVGTNAVNDYFDAGATGAGARAAPARTPLRRLAYVCYAAGTAIGLLLVAARGIEVLWLGLSGFLLGVVYSAPPVRLAHRGLGELAVAVGFGPLIVLGAYFVQRQAWSLDAFIASLPLAFLIAAVLYISEFPDREGDASVGKRTLIVRLPERAAVIGYVVLLGLAYIVIVGGVALRGVPRFAAFAFPPWTLLGLATLPLAAKGSLLLARNYRYPYRLVASNPSAIALHLTTAGLYCAGHLLALIA